MDHPPLLRLEKVVQDEALIEIHLEVDQENPLHQISFQLINQLITNTME